jgi:hypothetical protein
MRPVVFERLKKLVSKGYMVRWGESEQDTLRLEHPRAPDLTLFADGRIWVLTVPPDDWITIENDADRGRFQSFVSPNDWIAVDNEADQRRFKSFVARVPKPTTSQRLKAMTVEDVWIRVVVGTVIVMAFTVFGVLTAWFFG